MSINIIWCNCVLFFNEQWLTVFCGNFFKCMHTQLAQQSSLKGSNAKHHYNFLLELGIQVRIMRFHSDVRIYFPNPHKLQAVCGFSVWHIWSHMRTIRNAQMKKKRMSNSISYAIPGHTCMFYEATPWMLKIFKIYIVGFAMEGYFSLEDVIFLQLWGLIMTTFCLPALYPIVIPGQSCVADPEQRGIITPRVKISTWFEVFLNIFVFWLLFK